jgi:cysteinyl-tRNA synthetase
MKHTEASQLLSDGVGNISHFAEQFLTTGEYRRNKQEVTSAFTHVINFKHQHVYKTLQVKQDSLFDNGGQLQSKVRRIKSPELKRWFSAVGKISKGSTHENFFAMTLTTSTHDFYVTNKQDFWRQVAVTTGTKEFAYKTANGDVFFRVRKIKNYGQLSHVDLDEIKVGARVEENQNKEDPLDFALWKHTTEGITFSAPFGDGRPGWHTECVVMIQETFQQPLIDIHGGGFDLKFPHHENEIAQSQAMHQTHLANYWLHNGFINLNAEKMSKSTGNIFLAKDFLSKYDAPLLRYLLLSTHYRMPVNITSTIIENTQQELLKLQISVQQLASFIQLHGGQLTNNPLPAPLEFLQALSNDINTANALTYLHQYLKTTNAFLREKTPSIKDLIHRFFTIQAMLTILGLLISFPILTHDDHQLYQDYVSAKQAQDFLKSDAIRDLLKKRLIII